jgi:hypothetical protein
VTGSVGANLAQSRSQLIKLLALVALAGVIGVSLLSARQQLLLAAHELATLHQQERQDARTVLQLRGEIAERLTLPALRADAASIGVAEPAVGVASAPPLSNTQGGLDSTTPKRESIE